MIGQEQTPLKVRGRHWAFLEKAHAQIPLNNVHRAWVLLLVGFVSEQMVKSILLAYLPLCRHNPCMGHSAL